MKWRQKDKKKVMTAFKKILKELRIWPCQIDYFFMEAQDPEDKEIDIKLAYTFPYEEIIYLTWPDPQFLENLFEGRHNFLLIFLLPFHLLHPRKRLKVTPVTVDWANASPVHSTVPSGDRLYTSLVVVSSSEVVNV